MPHTQPVFDFLERSVADAGVCGWSTRLGTVRSLLYVGWRHDCKPWWHDWFCRKLGAQRTAVLEIFPQNFSELEQQIWWGRYEATPILGDVREIEKHAASGEWDVIFWDHGPEHVALDELAPTIEKMKERVGRLLLCCGPWGLWPQEKTADGNEHEAHRTVLTPELLRGLGLEVVCFGGSGQENGGELVASYFR